MNIQRGLRTAITALLIASLAGCMLGNQPGNDGEIRRPDQYEDPNRGAESLLGDMLELEQSVSTLQNELDSARSQLRDSEASVANLRDQLESERQRRAAAESDARRHGATRTALEAQVLTWQIRAAEFERQLLEMQLNARTNPLASPGRGN